MKRKSKTDWAYIDALPDEKIDYTEIPEQGAEFFKNAILVMPETKAVITLRIDRDILSWFKKQGRGYQTRINALLRAYMQAHRKTAKHK